jgi:AcrR family transcriptional regulator
VTPQIIPHPSRGSLVAVPTDPLAIGDELGRRARKKLETRRALVTAALDLFANQGVDETTVDEIADAVDVSARTFHRYFATKEDVLFADSDARCADFAAFLDSRPMSEPVLDTLRAAAHGLTDSFLTDPVNERRRMSLVGTTPTLRAMSLQHTDMLSDLVAEHLADRLSVATTDPLPRLLAACTIAALRTARERWLDDVEVDYHAEIDRCFALVGDLRTATTPHS